MTKPESHVIQYHFLIMVLHLLGYKDEPVTGLTKTWVHPRGTRIGLPLFGKFWYNIGHTP